MQTEAYCERCDVVTTQEMRPYTDAIGTRFDSLWFCDCKTCNLCNTVKEPVPDDDRPWAEWVPVREPMTRELWWWHFIHGAPKDEDPAFYAKLNRVAEKYCNSAGGLGYYDLPDGELT